MGTKKKTYSINAYIKFALTTANDLSFLIKTGAPLFLISKYLSGRLSNDSAIFAFKSETQKFLRTKQTLCITTDWFCGNVPQWFSIIAELKLADQSELNVLEIGSWEGLSTVFIASTLPYAKITCVDTWAGADEHKSGDLSPISSLSEIEGRFDKNTSSYATRIKKFKSTSFGFYLASHLKNHFDLIYIDGSHHCNDVMIDAIECFDALKVGGVIIFDDFLWKYYERARDNPAGAINAFLRMKMGKFKIMRIYYQLAIQKTET